MIEDNDHLKPSSPSYSRSRQYVHVYDQSKIPLIHERSKRIPSDTLVGVYPVQDWSYERGLGVLNCTWIRFRPKSYQKEEQVRVSGRTDIQDKLKSKLNKNNLQVNINGQRITGRFDDKDILSAKCEISGKTMPVQTQEWISDAFSFRDHIGTDAKEQIFRDMASEDKETRKNAFLSMFDIEYETKEGAYSGRGDELQEYVKSFKVIPEKTPFLNDSQRKWLEQQVATKTVKSKDIMQFTRKHMNEFLVTLFAGKTRSSYGQGQWVGIPALIKLNPNMVAVRHIIDTTYDERSDTTSHKYDTTVVDTSYVQDMNKKTSPNYERFIIDEKKANEKAIGVTDKHKKACKVCGKKDHNARNCTIWDENTQAMKEAYDAGVGFKKAMTEDIEFTVFKAPLPLVRKSTRYGVSTLLKTNLYLSDSRKPFATLVLWGDNADDYLEWMNDQTLGDTWAKSQTKQEDLQAWYKEHGGVDALTHDRLILKAHQAFVKRPRYKNKEAWAIEVGINPQHGAYLEYTGENYRFVPREDRAEFDEMYERVKISKPVMIIG